tara:strand:+ start:174 stop:1733 length:1560 start_codon:yes stop_codon:yes gene_type:complete
LVETLEKLLIIDFGSQFTQLIARRLRELGVFSEIIPFQKVTEQSLEVYNPKAIILSGGPASVLNKNCPTPPLNLFKINIPILGICYGLQIIVKVLNGTVERGEGTAEFGRSFLNKTDIQSELVDGMFSKGNEQVWMSHGDHVSKVPENFEVIASTENAPYAIIGHKEKKIYGVQFHPEVYHTLNGSKFLDNFLNISGFKKNWTMGSYKEIKIDQLKSIIGDQKVICALSGGVDSSVTAALIHEAIGSNLTCVYVDHGMMRLNESNEIIEMFKEHFNLNIIHANETELFLNALKGIIDPEEKRKIIGRLFIEVFSKYSNEIGNIKFLAQGTLYPDVIESVSFTGGPSETIKSHHNVGGLPKNMQLELVEPLRELFKDEVRKLGIELGLPKSFISRHPFPGPGLAIRCPGEVTDTKLNILKQADSIFIKQIKKYDLYDKIWQAFVVLLPVKTVGVMGDGRTYDFVCSLRAVSSVDGMTADFYPFDAKFLSETSTKIINEVNGINRVTYDITSKPPGTIEWE